MLVSQLTKFSILINDHEESDTVPQGDALLTFATCYSINKSTKTVSIPIGDMELDAARSIEKELIYAHGSSSEIDAAEEAQYSAVQESNYTSKDKEGRIMTIMTVPDDLCVLAEKIREWVRNVPPTENLHVSLSR